MGKLAEKSSRKLDGVEPGAAVPLSSRTRGSAEWDWCLKSAVRLNPKPGARSLVYFGGTYSFGFADPSPKKNISSCFTITS